MGIQQLNGFDSKYKAETVVQQDGGLITSIKDSSGNIVKKVYQHAGITSNDSAILFPDVGIVKSENFFTWLKSNWQLAVIGGICIFLLIRD